MNNDRKKSISGRMLELWRPPREAGDPIGCMSTTYTFAPGLFDEQCLARFLEIGSEPDREDLAFLLERESRLGAIYAGVLADHTQAGVEHSLRWDVLPVRIRGGKQHAKLSLLAWSRHIRLIVSSANLTEMGYRTRHEVTATVEMMPTNADSDLLAAALAFLRRLLQFVPGPPDDLPEIRRATAFLDQVEELARGWKRGKRAGPVRRQLVFTLPNKEEQPASSSLEEAIYECRKRGGSPSVARVASPFFDPGDERDETTAALCKLMARGEKRVLYFCVPAGGSDDEVSVPRLAAPRSLLKTPPVYGGSVTIYTLPECDGDKNRRSWHAKMIALAATDYSALMIGSSNFTMAGMGVKHLHNAEANLLTIADRVAFGRAAGQLEAVWPELKLVENPESAEWLGVQPDPEEDIPAPPPLPAGFLSAGYHAGDERWIVLRLDPEHLPEEWQVISFGQDQRMLLTSTEWHEIGREPLMRINWPPIHPPVKLLIRWDSHEAFLPLNVEDSHGLPPPAQLNGMSANDMLWILAAADPSAAFRAWVGRQRPEQIDLDLDMATPIDLNPLRRYELQSTFLHRVRHRARILAQLRANLQRPVCSRQALEWRLRGLIGVEALADRFLKEITASGDAAEEALLTLADFLIVLIEVDYQPAEGFLPEADFEVVYRAFLRELAGKLQREVEAHCDQLSDDLRNFWERVLKRGSG